MRRRWARAACLLLGVLGVVTPPAGQAGVWLGLRAPREDVVVHGPVPMIEVFGRAGRSAGGRRDVVIVLDFSGSTLIASGIDVDRDGKLGYSSRRLMRALRHGYWPRVYNPRQINTDFGDSVRAAEVAAARRLIELLDSELTRVGLVVFHSDAFRVAPLGAPSAFVLETLDELGRSGSPLGGTNFRAAIDAALDTFAEAPPTPADEPAERSVLFLSDGEPTEPRGGNRPERAARDAAQRARKAGVRIHAFALGPLEHLDVYQEIADLTGGDLTPVEEPATIIDRLPRVRLAEVTDVEVRNLTTGQEGRAVRVFPDGSFDGFAPLAPGENRLRVTARTPAGEEISVERSVRFEPREARTPEEESEQREEWARFRKLLETRTLETQALIEIQAGRAAQRKELEMEADREPAPD